MTKARVIEEPDDGKTIKSGSGVAAGRATALPTTAHPTRRIEAPINVVSKMNVDT